MNLREWLFIAGVVIILGILIDGIRRMRLAKQDSLKMSRDLGGHIDASPLDDDFNPELPGGGVRVIKPGDEQVDVKIAADGMSDSSLAGAGNSVVDDVSGDDADASVASTVKASVNDQQPASVASEDPEKTKVKVEPSLGLDLSRSSKSSKASNLEATEVEEGLIGGPRVIKAESRKKSAPAKKGRQEKKRASPSNTSQQEHEVIVINVDAPAGKSFSGAAIKNLLEACGMKHGDMSIFHRHEEDDLLSPIQFSVANAVEPGYFDPEKLESIQTPGVSFFMSIPGPKDYLKAFEFMNETAKCFAENLHGDLKDENRSVLTAQTVEHNRQRIREFERKQMCKVR
jgi:cell division protein ZipA